MAEISVVKGALYGFNELIAHVSLAIELPVLPEALIGDAGLGIVELTVAIHFIILPVTIIIHSVVVVQETLPLSTAIHSQALVPTNALDLKFAPLGLGAVGL